MLWLSLARGVILMAVRWSLSYGGTAASVVDMQKTNLLELECYSLASGELARRRPRRV